MFPTPAFNSIANLLFSDGPLSILHHELHYKEQQARLGGTGVARSAGSHEIYLLGCGD
jgi:hypothetical protein